MSYPPTGDLAKVLPHFDLLFAFQLTRGGNQCYCSAVIHSMKVYIFLMRHISEDIILLLDMD